MVMVTKERLGLAFLLLLLIGIFSAPAHAQFTNVSAIVQDTNGNLYPNCSYSVDYVYSVGSSQNPLLGGSPFQMSYGGAKCDSFAAFAIRLPDNNFITPSGSQWRFSICDSTGTKCFTSAITITGANQDITATLKPLAPILNPSIIAPSLVSVPFSTTPVFDASRGSSFEITLTGNVTSATIINTVSGQIITFMFIQDGTGNRTFVWPVNIFNMTDVNPIAGSITTQSFIARGNGNLYPIGPALYN